MTLKARVLFWVLAVVAMAAGAAGVRSRLRAIADQVAISDSVSPAQQEVPPQRPLEFSSVAAHFEATAALRADQVALRTASGAVTYGELLTTVTRWAQVSPPQGALSPATLAVVSLDADTVSMVLGMFASGITVVAMDPATPDNRTALIESILVDHGYTVTRVDPRADSPPLDNTSGSRGLGAGFGVDEVTSIQFTSGSTGTPKAVVHKQGLWLADAQLLNDRFGFADGRKVALCMPISFGAGLNVLVGSLLGGAQVIGIDPREYSGREAFARIDASGAEAIACTPAFIDILHTAAQGAILAGVTRIVATGEAIHARHIRLARELAPRAVVTNWVGSSETSAIASYDIPPDAPLPRGVIPGGVPAPHKKIEIGDDGTVSITSRHLSAGYLDPAANTAFVGNPDGTTTYAGGDVGRWDAQGNLVLSGRADSTVKIRGYLVEPAEIEVTLLSYDDVREAVVTADRSQPTTLTAYVSLSTTIKTPSVAELRTRLHRDLPPWMVPTHLVVLPALPRGERGKIDRMALPKPERPTFDPPRGQQESLIGRVWAEVLHVDAVGRHDSFYSLGGDSMSVVQMLTALRDEHGIVLQPTDLASAPTVAEFAARITTGNPVPDASPLSVTTVPLRAISPATGGTPLLCFTGAGASALTFAPLADQVGTGTAVYAFEPKGLQKRGVPDLSVVRAARRHLPEVRRIQPDGPYTLIGHSLGSHIALEVAQLLEADGAEVELVVMLDPWLPPTVARDARKELTDVTLTLENAEAAGGFKLWWDRQKQVPLAGLFVGGYGRRTMAIEEFGMMTGYFHTPRPWAGRARVVLSHLNRDDPRLWPRILTGDLETQVVDCSHHSIVREPYVGTVAELIGAARRTVEVNATA
jgi:acyl-CoA synthetase (AMP-forming)/AMP-acid ligase II/thioesterase domain-containing protein/acyl carrier protein